ncbi:MAG: translocation/assembly module TamB domain-containing protein [Halorhodospira sp.]
MGRRLLKGVGLSLAALLGALLLALAWLLLTTSGARAVVALAAALEPRLEAQVVDGSLARGVAVEAVAWRDAGTEVTVDVAALRWRPLRLLHGELRVEALSAAGVHAKLPAEAVEEQEEPVQTPEEPITLPSIDVPLTVRLESLRIRDVRMTTGDGAEQRIQRLEAALSVTGSEWRLHRLLVEREDARVEAQGRLHTREAYPLALLVRGSLAAPGLPERLRFSSRLGGSVAALRASTSLAGPVSGRIGLSLRPLDPRLPVQIEAEEVVAGWPLDSRDIVSAEGLDLTASGDREGLSGHLETSLGGGLIPQGRWRSDFRVTPEGAVLEELTAELLGGRLTGGAHLGWDAEGVRWDVAAEAEELDASREWAQAPDGVTGPLAVTGRAGAAGWALDVETPGLHGVLQDHPVTLRGGVAHTLAGAWQLRDLHAESEGGELRADGELADRWDLDLAVDVTDLGLLEERLGGELSAQAHLSGDAEAPTIVSEGRGRGLSWAEGNRVETLDWAAQVPALAQEPGDVRIEASGIDLPPVQGAEATLHATGSRSAHHLALRGQVDERGDARLDLTGNWRPGRGWEGLMVEADGEVDGHAVTLEAPFPLRYAEGELALDAHTWRYREARLQLPDGVRAGPDGAALAFNLSAFDLSWLDPLLPAQVDWEGGLAGEGSLAWDPEEGVRADLDAASEGGRLAMAQPREEAAEEPEVRELVYQRLALSGDYRPEEAQAELTLESEDAGDLGLRLRGDPRPEGEQVAGSLSLKGIRLAFFRPLIPELSELGGELEADVALRGTRSEPQLDGRIDLREGRVAVPQSGSTIEAMGMRVDLEGQAASLDGGFRVGDGSAELSGRADWEGAQWEGQVDLNGEELLADVPPYAELAISPRLSLEATPGSARLSGQVTVPRGRIEVRELPEQVVRPSSDVVIVDQQAEGVAAPVPEGWDVAAELEVILGDAVSLAAFGVRGQLAGALRALQRPDGATEAFGELRIEDGEYRAYGQRLRIRRGLILFAGPANRPQLDIEAVRRIERDGVTAGIRVEGFADQPQLSLFSEPGMSGENALSYLLRGRPMGAEGPGEDQMLASAALALGLYGGSGVVSSVAEQAGVQDFEIDAAGEGEDAQVVVSGYISPRLYVSYGVGVFSPVNTVTMRYFLTQQLYLEGISGEDSSLDLMYRFEID